MYVVAQKWGSPLPVWARLTGSLGHPTREGEEGLSKENLLHFNFTKFWALFALYCTDIFRIYEYIHFRIVNKTSTEASLTPGMDQLFSTNSWPVVHKAHNVVRLGLCPEYLNRSRTLARFLVVVLIVMLSRLCKAS